MYSKIKEILKKSHLIVALYERYAETFRIYLDKIRRNKVYHYGDKNVDKTFFLISFKPGGAETMYSRMGIYSLTMCFALPFIDFALKRGWIPVIDLKDSYVPALQDIGRMNLENAWEYYYEQPIEGISLEEVYQSRRVLNGWYWRHEVTGPLWNAAFPQIARALEQRRSENFQDKAVQEEQELKYWHEIITKYIRLNKNLEKRFVVEKNKVFKSCHKVLGVGIRAEYRIGIEKDDPLYNNHPKQPSCDEMMNIIENKMNTWGCDGIFVSCDDREYLKKFISHFGDKCCYMERRRMNFFLSDETVAPEENWLAEFEGVTRREQTEEYIIETYLLAQCECLYCGIAGGTEFAFFLNGGRYEHVETYDKGVYEGLGKDINKQH